MNPALIVLVFSMVEQLIKEEPEIAAELQAIFTKGNPTPADWLALHQKVLAKSYADYVPASALPATAAAAPVPPVTAAAENPVVAIAAVQSNALQEAASASNPDPVATAAVIPAYLPDGSKNPDHAA